MTNPAEKANINRLRQLVSTDGQLEQTQGDFRSTVSQYLNETLPVLTHPHVAERLLISQGESVIDISNNIPISGLTIPLRFCLYPDSQNTELREYKVGIKGESRRSRSGLLSDEHNTKFQVEAIMRTYFPSNVPSTEIFFRDNSNNDRDYQSYYQQYSHTYAIILPIQVEHFVQHPEIFPVFRNGVNSTIEKVLPLLETRMKSMSSGVARKVFQETVASTIPGATISLPPDQPLTETQIQGIVHQAIEQNPRIRQLEQNGATKQDLQAMLTALMETTAKDTTRAHNPQVLQQAYATLRYFAGGNTQAQQAVEAFITNSVNLKDPDRVFSAVLKIVGGFVPGAQGVVALVEALKEWTRP